MPGKYQSEMRLSEILETGGEDYDEDEDDFDQADWIKEQRTKI